MNELLESAATRAARYLDEIQRACRGAVPRSRRASRGPARAVSRRPERARRRARAAGRDRLAGDHGHRRPALLRLRDRGLAAVRRGRELARRRPGIRTPATTPDPGRVDARVGLARLDARDLRIARGVRRRLRHRRHDGQLQLAGRGPARGARGPGLGRRGRRPLRRAADHGRDRRGGASDADQGARAGRVRAQPAACACPWTGRAACSPSSCRRSRRRRSCAHRPATSTPAPSTRWPRSRARTHEAGAWLHVDGAFGLWAAAAPERAHLVEGAALADSLATDAHKCAERPVRQRPRLRPRRRRAARRDGGDRRVPAGRARRAQPVGLHAGALAPRPRGRGLGGAAHARPLGPGRSHRGPVPARERVRGGTVRGRLRDPQRRRVQPGAGLVRRARRDAARSRRRPGRRHLLVRRHGLAGPDGHAHQRVVVGDHGGRRGGQPRGHAARGARA